ncbi:hypothetical protein BBP40_009770 [Aspergillus hancockii]|nr:hypothetical protein BBP40_009770 [Aspergillus hancockii]
MTPILSLSVENLARILGSCDTFPQLVALSKTCKLINWAFKTNLPSILWRVGNNDIYAFNDALVTVRATQTILDCFNRGQHPPAFIQPMYQQSSFCERGRKDEESIYGPLAVYFVDQSRMRARREATDKTPVYPAYASPIGLDRAQANKLYAETIQCLFAFMTLWGYEGHGLILQALCFNETLSGKFGRKVTVISMDEFYPENVFMPTYAEDAWETQVLRRKAAAPFDVKSAFIDHVSSVLEYVAAPPHWPYRRGIVNPELPIRLQVFDFILQNFLGLRLADKPALGRFMGNYDIGNIYYEDGETWPETVEGLILPLDQRDRETS